MEDLNKVFRLELNENKTEVYILYKSAYCIQTECLVCVLDF